MSFPLFGETLDFTQPDGTPFRVRAWGDQSHARFETLDRFEVVRDAATGFYCYATTTPEQDELRPTLLQVGIDPAPLATGMAVGPLIQATDVTLHANTTPLPRPRWRERLEERRLSEQLHILSSGVTPAPPSRHTTGDFLGLCLLIDFSDSPATIPWEEVDAYCNRPGYRGFGNNGSVYDYFLDNSGGRLRYRTLVTPYYRASRPKSYYTDPARPYTERARDLIKEALAYHLNHGFSFGSLSVDAAQRVFATNALYAGEVKNNWSEGLWPHASRLAAPYPLTPGIMADDYQISAMGGSLSLGTYCHENGHMLCDFPDLYQYSNQSLGIGKFCLMCGGGNADPKNPVKVSGYLKYRAGWGNETVLDTGMQISTLPDDGRLFVHARGNGEYFIIENRQKTGRDSALPGSGLAVWHIDELGSNSEPQTAPPGHRHHECVLIQADGQGQLDSGSNDGDAGDLYETVQGTALSAETRPSSQWWDERPSGLEIRDIAVNGTTIAFSVKL